MDFSFGPRVSALRQRLLAFMDEVVYPHHAAAADRWQSPPILDELQIAPEVFNCDTGNMEVLVRCGCSTDLTRCTAGPSPASSCGSSARRGPLTRRRA